MTDVSQLSDAQLLSLVALPALKKRESNNTPGVLGPQTPYGQAQGMTQMLPKTAQAMAQRLGVPWRPELMTGSTPEAAAYQEQLGQAYLQEGIEKTGNLQDGLRYYHGGPDRKLWGPKTEAYAQAISQSVGYAPQAAPKPLDGLTDAELIALAKAKGVSIPTKPQPKPITPKPVTVDQMRAFAGGVPYKPVGPVFQPVNDFLAPIKAAGKQFSAGIREDMRKTATARPPANPLEFASGFVDSQLRTAQRLGEAAGLVFSPLTGGVDAAISAPGGRLMAKYGPTAYASPSLAVRDGRIALAPARPMSQQETADWGKNLINTAMMAARPAPGFKPSPPAPTLTPVEKKAGDYVERLARSGKVSPDDLRAAPAPMTGAEAMGRNSQSAVGALIRREGATGDMFAGELGARAQSRPQRILDAFADASGITPEDAAGDIQSLVARGREAAAPLYEQAYAAGPVDSPTLKGLAQRPSVKGAMQRAIRIAAEEGRDPTAIGFDVKPGLGGLPEQVQVKQPTAQTWDYVKRGLDDILEGYRDKTTGKLRLDEEGRAIVSTLRDLRNAVIKENDAYRVALETAGDYMSANDAFRTAGRDLFNAKLTERQFAEKVAKMSASDRQAYAAGAANQFFDLAQNGRLDPKVVKSPRVKEKLATLLGNDRADGLIEAIAKEAEMLAFERRYAPGAGSITQEMKAAMDAQDGNDVAVNLGIDFAKNLNRGPIEAAGRAVGGQIQRSLDAFGRTRGMSVPVRDKAGELLLVPPDQLADFLEKYLAAKRQGGLFGSRAREVLPLALPSAVQIGETGRPRPTAIDQRR